MRAMKGDWRDLFTVFRIALDPRNAGLIQSQASTFERLGRYEEAVRYFDKALMLAPDSSGVMFKRAFTVFNASGDTSALRDFIQHNPGSFKAPSDYMKWLVEFLDGNYEASLNALKNWELDVFAFQGIEGSLHCRRLLLLSRFP